MKNCYRIISLLAAAVLSLQCLAVKAKDSEKPNILFILADDLGYADLSSYGRRDYQTPVLDKLADDGLKMTQAYASAAICSPTRTALLTGRYRDRLRVGLEEPLAFQEAGMPPEHATFATQLREVGYDTTLVGKWHLGYPPEHGPLKSGYDHFFGFYPGGVDYFAHRIEHGKEGLLSVPNDADGLYRDDEKVEADGYLTDILTDEAIDYIRASSSEGNPFFMSLHYSAPHWPWEGPNDVKRSRELTTIADTDGGNIAIYAQMMKSLDSNIGRVLAELEKLGIADNTIVVFTSDNGGERFSDNWPLIGMKTELLEGGIRVPAIVRWPGKVPSGTVSEQVIASMDWMPTLLAAAGGQADPDYPLDGENLLPVLTGSEPARERTLFWRYKARDQGAVRSGDWKYLRRDDGEYLFNLANDERERANLSKKEPEVLERLKQAYEEWNSTMLPYPEDSYSADARTFTDRY